MKKTVACILLFCMLLCMTALAEDSQESRRTLLSVDSMWYAPVRDACHYSCYAPEMLEHGACYLVIADGQVSLYWSDVEQFSPVPSQEGNHEPYMFGMKYTGEAMAVSDDVNVDFGSCKARLTLQDDSLQVVFTYEDGTEKSCSYLPSVTSVVNTQPKAGAMPDLTQNGAWKCDLYTNMLEYEYWDYGLNASRLVVEDGRIYLLSRFLKDDLSGLGLAMQQGRLNIPNVGYINSLLPRCYTSFVTTNHVNYRIGATRETEHGLEVVFPAMDLYYIGVEKDDGKSVDYTIALANDPYCDIWAEAPEYYTIPEVRMLITQQDDGSLSVVCADAPGLPVLTYNPCMNLNVQETYAGKTWYPGGTLSETEAQLSVSATKKGVLSLNYGKKTTKIKTQKIENSYLVFLEAGAEEKKSPYFKSVKNKHRGTSRQQLIVQEDTSITLGGTCYQLSEGALQGKVVSKVIDEATGFLWIETSKGLKYRYCYAPFEYGGVYIDDYDGKVGSLKGEIDATMTTGDITFGKVMFDRQTPPADVRKQPEDYAAVVRVYEWGGISDDDCAQIVDAWKSAIITVDENKKICTVKIGKKTQKFDLAQYWLEYLNVSDLEYMVEPARNSEIGYTAYGDYAKVRLLPASMVAQLPEGLIGTWENPRLILDGNADHPWLSQLTEAETRFYERLIFTEDHSVTAEYKERIVIPENNVDVVVDRADQYIYFYAADADKVYVDASMGNGYLTMQEGALHLVRPDKGYTIVYERADAVQ